MNKRNTERIIKKLEWAKKKCRETIDKTTKKYCVKIRVAFNKIKNDVVKEWYEDYGGNLKIAPMGYHRTLGLLKISKIDVNKDTGDIIVRFDENNMTLWHRVSNEYIYQNSFVKGWHGGADKLGSSPKPGYEEPHPNPGIPYWRTPQPDEAAITGELPYEHWFDHPAARTTFNGLGPRDEIMRRFQIEFDRLMEEMDNEQAEYIQNIFLEIANYIKNHS